ncbi:hypothetical protein ES332_D04G141400v1 [Gossypium tomentosum]|uniref:Secreted protein n=1 Tax=Gossypium tomentosum TaxID=34277 RepID=A0A5D2LE96_GOSTO|nr:hypothetical protein ES332_D04G141400v1 [Gossypium tomentosum]
MFAIFFWCFHRSKFVFDLGCLEVSLLRHQNSSVKIERCKTLLQHLVSLRSAYFDRGKCSTTFIRA